MIAIILGPDHSMARESLRRILMERDPSGQSTSSIDGKTASLKDVQMDATSVGFFSAGRVVIVEDVIATLGKQGAKDGGNPADWKGLFAAIPAVSTLILFDPTLSSVTATVKKALPREAEIIMSDPPRGRELLRWIQSHARSEGSDIDERTARLLAETLFPQGWSMKSSNPAFDRPPDLEALRHQIAKLAVAAHPDQIRPEQITSLIGQGDNDQIFRFLDAASSGRVKEAVVELDRLLGAGEDPGKLLAQLGQTVELSVVMAAAERRSPSEVGKDLRLANPNRMNSIDQTVRNQAPGQPAAAARALEAADRRMKTGELRDPVDALYDVLAAISASRGKSR